MATAELSLATAMKGVTLDVVVTGSRRMGVRFWLGAQIIKLGARVVGCGGVEVCAADLPADEEVVHYRLPQGDMKHVVRNLRMHEDT